MVLNERLTDEVGCRILIFRCNVSNEIIFCGIIHHDQCGRTVQSSASCFGLLNSGSSGPELSLLYFNKLKRINFNLGKVLPLMFSPHQLVGCTPGHK